jgi:hypothetical protein
VRPITTRASGCFDGFAHGIEIVRISIRRDLGHISADELVR